MEINHKYKLSQCQKFNDVFALVKMQKAFLNIIGIAIGHVTL